jgi:hypothetical protein
MQINTHLFQAAATIYSGLIGASTNQLPQDPSHAHQAVEYANRLYSAAHQDGNLTIAASRILIGFLDNPRSKHCTSEELIGWSLQGARNLIEAFSAPIRVPAANPAQPFTAQPFAQPVHPQMPPQQSLSMNIPPPVPPQPQLAQPTAPAVIPDFTEGKS